MDTNLHSICHRQTDEPSTEVISTDGGKEGSKEHDTVADELQADGQPPVTILQNQNF